MTDGPLRRILTDQFMDHRQTSKIFKNSISSYLSHFKKNMLKFCTKGVECVVIHNFVNKLTFNVKRTEICVNIFSFNIYVHYFTQICLACQRNWL